MTVLNIDPQVYYTAARRCRELADDIGLAFGPLHATLNQCGGMAGDYDHVRSWSSAYDQQCADFVNTVTTLANALLRFGDVLGASGHNWAVAEHRANPKSNSGNVPDAPPSSGGPMYDGDMPLPSTVFGNGPGLSTNVSGLVEKVGIPIPNGDTGKLDGAATAWATFAKHDTITGAKGRITAIADTFRAAGVQAPDMADIEDHLATLAKGADAVAQASAGFAAPVRTHHDDLASLRGAMNSQASSLLAMLAVTGAVTAIAVVLTTIGTAGAGAAGPDEAEVAGGAAAEAAAIAKAADTIRSLITGSELLAVLAGATTAIFLSMDGLTVNKALQAISAMTVAMVAEGEGHHDGAGEDDDFEGTGFSLDELAEMARGHAGDDNPAMGRPSLDEIEQTLKSGEKSPGDGNSVKYDYTVGGKLVRVIVNRSIPWKSTTYYPSR